MTRQRAEELAGMIVQGRSPCRQVAPLRTILTNVLDGDFQPAMDAARELPEAETAAILRAVGFMEGWRMACLYHEWDFEKDRREG